MKRKYVFYGALALSSLFWAKSAVAATPPPDPGASTYQVRVTVGRLVRAMNPDIKVTSVTVSCRQYRLLRWLCYANYVVWDDGGPEGTITAEFAGLFLTAPALPYAWKPDTGKFRIPLYALGGASPKFELRGWRIESA